jgi:S-formylglutathione hydrolase FrmB
MESTRDPAPEPTSRYSRSGLALRALAAALVIVTSVAVSELLLDSRDGPSGTAGARVIDYEVESEAIGEALPVKVVVPRGARDGRRSLLLFLHGRGEDERSYLDEEMFGALARQGGRAPVVAFPRGGAESYWHDRAEDGAWGSYVLDELLPALVRRFDIEPERIAIGGISMGGFGAFDIARQEPFGLANGNLARFCAVGGHSPAIWTQASETAPGAFDDAADFDRRDLITLLGQQGSPLEGKRYWLDVGDEDPFREADEALAKALDAGGAQGRPYIGEGGHESSYWSSNWRRYMHFYARALKRCQQDTSAAGPASESKRSG